MNDLMLMLIAIGDGNPNHSDGVIWQKNGSHDPIVTPSSSNSNSNSTGPPTGWDSNNIGSTVPPNVHLLRWWRGSCLEDWRRLVSRQLGGISFH